MFACSQCALILPKSQIFILGAAMPHVGSNKADKGRDD